MSNAKLPTPSGSTSVEEIHLALLQALPEAMCFVDTEGAVRFWNERAESITGFSIAEAVCARRLTDVFFLSGADGHPILAIPEIDGTSKPYHYFLRHKDGYSTPVALRRLAVRTQGDHPLGTLLLFGESRNATQSGVGGNGLIPGRNREENGESLQWSSGDGKAAGLLLIQIDAFEEFERRLGPEASEKIFALVEQTTKNCLNADETCRRLPNGSVLASIDSAARLVPLANRLRALVQSSHVQWWGNTVTVTVSIGGTAVGPHDSPADAVRRTEDCVMRLTSAGGNQVMLVGG